MLVMSLPQCQQTHKPIVQTEVKLGSQTELWRGRAQRL